MKEYTIYYIGTEDGEELNMAGSAHGRNKNEAIKDFYFWHSDCKKIIKAELYR